MSASEFAGEGVQQAPGGRQVDLTNCDREPIHIPGSIQPHGVLMALTLPDLTIVQISNNTQQHLGIAPQQLLQQDLGTILQQPQVEYLRSCFSLEDLGSINPIKITLCIHDRTLLFDGVVHRSDGLMVLELEPTSSVEHIPFPSFYHVIRTSTATLQGAATLSVLCQAAAEEVRKITGFDRVMIYQFDEDWNGDVVAEARREELEPYLGLHYPASDIPRQARELYRRNWLRLIADVHYTPSVIIPTDNPLTDQPLDLSFSVLRSVSPVHIEYLKNMGVAASMSVSIIKNDQLWGLISCHHSTPRFVSYSVRGVCEFLGQILSLQLSAKEDFEDYAYEMHVREIQASLLDHLLQQENMLDVLKQHQQELLEMVGAHGAAFYSGGQYIPFGNAPEEAVGRRILEWLQQETREEVFATESLPGLWPEAEQYADVACGVLSTIISPLQGSAIVWFRPEIIEVVNWAGNPEKPVEMQDGTSVLHPRKSFELWSQSVRNRALPWKRCEIEAARGLRSVLIDRVLRTILLERAEELARLNAELENSNNELDSFAYIASHDLKEPLRGINNYALIIKEDYQQILDEAGKERVETLVRLGARMYDLIDALLHYSRVGRVDLAFAVTDLNKILERTLELLSVRLAEVGLEVRIPRPLPEIYCDRVRVGEIFQNLITNAMKYNDKAEKWVEIGYIDPQEQEGQNKTRPFVFFVRDNGIGIREKHYDAIFRIFRRLHGRDKFGGGTGAGLTIVKRIVERHGGQIWVESTYGQGTTFYFTLQKGV